VGCPMSQVGPGAEPVEVVGEVVWIDRRILHGREDEVRFRPSRSSGQLFLRLPCSMRPNQTVECRRQIEPPSGAFCLQITENKLCSSAGLLLQCRPRGVLVPAPWAALAGDAINAATSAITNTIAHRRPLRIFTVPSSPPQLFGGVGRACRPTPVNCLRPCWAA
jgi:hypothetical protein